MSFHLTEKNILEIERELGKMRRITWARLHDRVRERLGLPHSLSALKKNGRLKIAFNERKAYLRSLTVDPEDGGASEKASRDSMDLISGMGIREVESLERLMTILENATRLGIPVEEMERPMLPVYYSPTPKNGA